MKKFFRKFFDITFWKFIIVGIANTVFGMSIMFIFYNVFHFSYWFSTVSNYVFGSILSYFLNKYFTFKSKENSIKGILRFVINIGVCYFISYGLAKPIAYYLLSNCSLQIQDNIAMLVGMCLFVAFNYIGQRFFVFKNKA